MNVLVFTSLLQAFITWVIIGIIWFSQMVHYPLYVKIKEGFVEYERSHIRRVAYLMIPLMLIEAVSALILVGLASKGIIMKLAVVNLLLLFSVWLFTFLTQLTQHQKLSTRFSQETLHRLIRSNWVRTLLWTIKGLVMGVMLYFLM